MCLWGCLATAISLWCAYKIVDWLLRRPRLATPRGTVRSILVTGCDSGFGNLFANKMAAKPGYKVYAACLTEVGVSSLREQCSGDLTSFVMDVRSIESVTQAFQLVKEDLCQFTNHGSLWAIVNNAGIFGASGAMSWMDADAFMDVYKVNVLGQVNVLKAFLPLVKAAKGRVVNCSSIAGRLGMPWASPYSVSKYGVQALSDCLRREMQPFRVSVHIVEPGTHQTAMTNLDNYCAAFKSRWDKLPQADKDEYGEEYLEASIHQIREVMPKLSSNRLHDVVDAYEHAVTAVFPRGRYMPGLDARLFFWPLSLLPEWMSDWVFFMGSSLPKPRACQ